MANPDTEATTTPAATVAADTTAVQQQTAADTEVTTTTDPAQPTPAVEPTPPTEETPATTPAVGALDVTTVEPVNQVKSEPGIVVVDGDQQAQVVGTPFAPKTTVPVEEVHVVTDRVILDTSDPLAVQPGPSTPYPLTIGVGKTAEQQFAQSNDD